MNNLPVYANSDDRKCAHALIDFALVDGNTISINDSEEWVVKRSTDKRVILEAMASSGEDWLAVRDRDGVLLGQFYLIYQNGSEGEPMILIADCYANGYCNDMCDKLSALFPD